MGYLAGMRSPGGRMVESRLVWVVSIMKTVSWVGPTDTQVARAPGRPGRPNPRCALALRRGRRAEGQGAMRASLGGPLVGSPPGWEDGPAARRIVGPDVGYLHGPVIIRLSTCHTPLG